MTILDVTPVTRPTSTDELGHWACCLDNDVSLCGLDVTDASVVEFEEASCVVCEHLADSSFCPLGGPCINEEGAA